ncbi:Crp/Fnr family transcriptional regulator [Petrachloros mirabilis]
MASVASADNSLQSRAPSSGMSPIELCESCSKRESCAFWFLSQSGEPCSSIVVSQYSAGQTIVSQGGPNVGLHLICKGLVVVSRAPQRDCKCQSILYLLGKGEFIMPTESLLLKTQHTMSAQALTASTVLFMRTEVLHTFLSTNPSFVKPFLQQVAGMWASLEERYLVRDSGDASRRLAHALVLLSSMLGEQTAKGVRIPVTLNRSFLAHAIGATPETIGRLMSQFRAEHALTYSDHEIVIHQLERLQSFAEG